MSALKLEPESALPIPTECPGLVAGDEVYLALLDAINVPITVHRAGPLLFVNAAFEKLTGFNREALVGGAFETVAHPDFRELARQRGEARMRGEAVPSTYEFRVNTADPQCVCWADLSVSKIRLNGLPTIVGSFHDLTERRAAAAHQAYLHQMLGQIIEADPVPTLVIDNEHKVTHWNRACALISGIPAAEIIGTRRQWEAFYPSERPVMADLIVNGALEDGIETHYKGKYRRSATIADAYEAEDYFPRAGGTGRWLFFTAAPLKDMEGRIIGAIETLQDVTARHEAEDALRRHQEMLERLVEERTGQLQQANEQLMQSEKLASIGQLAAGVAHEINNPIGYVHSNIGALENYMGDLFEVLEIYEMAQPVIADPALAAAVKAKCEAVDVDFLKEDIPALMKESREGITRVKKIVQDLKDFSHVDNTQEWQWANLHAGIDSTINVVANEIKYKADVVKEYGQLPDVECLGSQLNQVFMNLLVNAAHAMGEARGTITIRSGSEGGDEGTVWLEFSDTGSGMPPEVQARIFEPFFTTKPVGKGTGLGLSLSYGIIQKHNGTLTVSSEPGKGTTFRIVLPVKHVESGSETTA
ncbi:MAG: PAS domain S-box protein [Zoogloeaceae bacterium]|nr:PAS domain S-box protein [Zoogloeaceae bacterium]